MKKRGLIMAAITAMAFGLVAVGCKSGGDSPANTEPKSITITGITAGITGSGTVRVLPSVSDDADITATGSGSITGGTLTVALKNGNANWTGSGAYYIFVQFENQNVIYTNGQAFDLNNLANLPKLTINSASTTVAFSKFRIMAGG